jgi:anti-anti-sigma factor
MEIEREKHEGHLLMRLRGELDATSSPAVQSALSDAVRSGEHHIRLDVADVNYVSSAGLRVLISAYKQLGAISGRFSICNPSAQVVKVLELSGLTALMARDAEPVVKEARGRTFQSARAVWEVFPGGEISTVRVRMVGEGDAWSGTGERIEFGEKDFGIGIGALAATHEEAGPRLGEVLAVSGCAAHLPTGDAKRPDFLISERDLRPEVWMISGLAGAGTLGRFLRFDVLPGEGAVGIEEVAESVCEAVGADALVLAMVAETSALVGAALRRSPAGEAQPGDPFAFPSVRDWLNFTSERAFRNSTSLIVGMVAKRGSAWDAQLRPLGEEGGRLGHFHAAAFPYRPVRKGMLPQAEGVAELFEGAGLQALLHLVHDTRGAGGVGESEFFRGACWAAPAVAAS